MTPEEILDIALAKSPDAAALKTAMLSEEFVRALQESIESDPFEKRRRDLVVAYGEGRGGLVLKLLRMFDGAYWGTGLELSFEQCALVLGEAPDKLEALYDEMLDEIRPHLGSARNAGVQMAGRKTGKVARAWAGRGQAKAKRRNAG